MYDLVIGETLLALLLFIHSSFLHILVGEVLGVKKVVHI